MVTKKFQSPTLWQLKNFSHQPCDDWKFFDRLSVATETFWSPWKGACHMFLESVQQRLTKNIWHTPFLATEKLWSPSDNGVVLDGNQIFSMTIKFNCNLTHPHDWMATEIFHLPKRAWRDMIFFQKWYYMCSPFQGDQKISITIWCTPIIEWWPKGVGHVLSFWGKRNHPPFYILGDQRISITIQWCEYVGWWLNFFNCLKRHGREGHEMA